MTYIKAFKVKTCFPDSFLISTRRNFYLKHSFIILKCKTEFYELIEKLC